MFAILSATGCASSRMSDTTSDQLFRSGRYLEAAERLKKGLEDEEEGRDQLLYLLDIGLSYHMAGNYAESNKYFLKADEVAEIKDYTNLAAEAGTLLTSDNIKHYKAEDFEYVLISSYLAINYTLMGQLEDALIEAKRVNRKLYRMQTEGKRKYKQDAFAMYLSGVLYEMSKEDDNAYISYKKTNEINKNYPGLGIDLYRMALRLNRNEDLNRWKKQYSLTSQDIQTAKELNDKRNKGQILIIYQNGISPVKRPHPNFYSIPKFVPRFNPVEYAEVSIDQKPRGQTYTLFDVQTAAIENLDEKYGGIIAKKVAGVVAKEIIGNQVAKQTKNEGLGLLVKFALYAADEADIRSWNLIPQSFQIARFPVDPGQHKIDLNLRGAMSKVDRPGIEVKSGEIVVLNFRYSP